jgi:multidrug efflux pump subunit AcrA (membrane-fusion protein)
MKHVVWCVALLGTSLAHSAGFECLVEPSQTVELRTAVDGLIDKVNVRRADIVRKGQALVELQSRTEIVAVESARFRSETRLRNLLGPMN